MSIGRITFSKNGKQACLELWGHRAGTRDEIRKSGAALLAELRATNKKAAVWIDGKRLKIASDLPLSCATQKVGASPNLQGEIPKTGAGV